jgi:thiol peroxidase
MVNYLLLAQSTCFQLSKTDLSIAALLDYAGSNVVLNIFPSVDTGTCAASVKSF